MQPTLKKNEINLKLPLLGFFGKLNFGELPQFFGTCMTKSLI